MPGVVTPPRTLYDKVFQDHIVDEKDDGTILLYIGKQAHMEACVPVSKLETSDNLERPTSRTRGDITGRCSRAHATINLMFTSL